MIGLGSDKNDHHEQWTSMSRSPSSKHYHHNSISQAGHMNLNTSLPSTYTDPHHQHEQWTPTSSQSWISDVQFDFRHFFLNFESSSLECSPLWFSPQGCSLLLGLTRVIYLNIWCPTKKGFVARVIYLHTRFPSKKGQTARSFASESQWGFL